MVRRGGGERKERKNGERERERGKIEGEREKKRETTLVVQGDTDWGRGETKSGGEREEGKKRSQNGHAEKAGDRLVRPAFCPSRGSQRQAQEWIDRLMDTTIWRMSALREICCSK